MTVNWRPSLLFFVLFTATVYGVQNSALRSGIPTVCSPPYMCITTSECAERHSAEGTDQVLFHCGKEEVCCPPVKTFQGVVTTTEISVQGCSQCSQNRPGSEYGGSVQPQQVGVNRPQNPDSRRPVQPSEVRRPSVSQPSEGRRPSVSQPSEGKRPSVSQPSEGRRPSLTQTPRPQTSDTSLNPPNSQGEWPQPHHHHHHHPQNPPTTQPPQRPQISQSQSPPHRPQTSPQRPQSSQTSTQNQPQSHHHQPETPSTSQNQPHELSNTQKQPSLTSHRNFRFLPAESDCGINYFANRITEGDEVSLGEYPWMVLTGVKDKYGNYRWNCGGTLINGWYVLTAAHCVFVENRTVEYVRLGEHSLANETDCFKELCLDPPEDITIAEVIPHEKWNTTTIKNDIALLRLSKNPLKLGKSNIHPICLPLDPEKLNITTSTKYEVAGWGKTDWNADEGSDVLKKASISGVTREECNICKDKKKQQYCPITDTQLCVQGWKGVDVCKGDSGGPLMVTRLNIYQIGVTSFKGSEFCGAENIPSIFTKVESYLPWILDNIKQ